MPTCLGFQQCLQKYVHWPGLLEAGLHCLYTGFFVIEAATYGLILEQKFHGVLQIVLINFYLVLLCLVFIRWNMDMNAAVCHLLISLLSFILTLFVGKLILMYINYMERPMKLWRNRPLDGLSPGSNKTHNNEDNLLTNQDIENVSPKKVPAGIMKLDPLIVILDISVYLLISVSYIVMLIKISVKLRNNSKHNRGESSSQNHQHQITSRSSLPPHFNGIDSSESSFVSSSNT